MNKLVIIGNLTRDPQVRTVNTQNGAQTVCSFGVAVNRKNGRDEADFFNVSAWGHLGESCAKWLAKGRKVCVTGPVSCRVYQTQDGRAAATMEINAADVEFLSSGQGAADAPQAPAAAPAPAGMTAVNVDDAELPF